ncbi:sentrin-specific protease 2 isoform X1 [Podarcis lilfordi]|uniref:Sentrin-specific protease 2 isoform X1 n=2 Tax=Podarcis lilfordi TaxID=74358 RepID=A0AA35KD31_9SAUR|nr:sentrin-specific protease 2 isoform X1 [Podarcis lilfordi]
MYKWLSQALRSWLLPSPPYRRDAEPSLPRPRKRRHPSTWWHAEDPDEKQAKRQKLGIFETLHQGIASLIKLPAHLTTKYFQTGDWHAETTDEIISNGSGSSDDKKMEPFSGMQKFELDTKTGCSTSMHPNEEMVTDCHRVKTCLRHECSVKKSSKKSHNSVQECLPAWKIATHKHFLETSPPETGRHLRKLHCTVEEAIQREEREKYKQLLEQEKEKCYKNHSSPTRAKCLDVQHEVHQPLKTHCCVEIDDPSFDTPRNGVKNFGCLCPQRAANSSVTVAERTPEPKKLVVHKKESLKHCLTNDLSEDVSRRLSLGQEESSYGRHSLVESEEQKYLSLDKATESLPYLTEDMEREIANVLNCGEDDEILTSAFKLNITRGDIQRLRDHQWLNDVVINFYMNLLMERNKQLGFPVLYAFNTFFYPKLSSEGYNGVRRWTKQVDLFQHDIILVPIHIRVHWALVVIDMRRETIKYFDSMGQDGHMICKRLLHFLQEESKARRNMVIKTSSWTLYSMEPHEIPQQLNGSDCGMFACKYADFISRDKPISFTQRHMPYYRKRMAWEILHQRLL